MSKLTPKVLAFSLFISCGLLSITHLNNNSYANIDINSRVSAGFYDNSEKVQVIPLIDQSKSTLYMEIYEMDDPKVLASLRRAISRGVTIHIVKEPRPVGASCRVFDAPNHIADVAANSRKPEAASCEDQRRLVDEVSRSGGSYVPFSKSAFCSGGNKNCLEHGKIVISDSKLALISTGNFNSSNLCDLEYHPTNCNRDYSYVTDDDAIVRTFQDIIKNDLTGQRYDLNAVISPEVSEKITVSPNSLTPLVSFIRSAKKDLLIENQYLKDPTINQAIISAARRGVQVQITLASACSFGKPRPNEAKRLSGIFNSFEEAGVRLRMFTKNVLINGHPGYMHAKSILVDGKRAWVGSVNGSTQAVTMNREFGIFFENPNEVKKLQTIMNRDFADPNSETWQESLDCAENEALMAN